MLPHTPRQSDRLIHTDLQLFTEFVDIRMLECGLLPHAMMQRVFAHRHGGLLDDER